MITRKKYIADQKTRKQNQPSKLVFWRHFRSLFATALRPAASEATELVELFLRSCASGSLVHMGTKQIHLPALSVVAYSYLDTLNQVYQFSFSNFLLLLNLCAFIGLPQNCNTSACIETIFTRLTSLVIWLQFVFHSDGIVLNAKLLQEALQLLTQNSVSRMAMSAL